MFVENLAPFFSQSGFAVAATWQPSWGGTLKSGNVILNMPDITVGAFHQDAISTDYRITFASADFIGLKESEFITVNGAKYRLHEAPRLLSDGAISEALLEKVA